jgi:hypothetical protein
MMSSYASFVIRIRKASGPVEEESGPMCGRVQHVQDGTEVSFRSLRELDEFILANLAPELSRALNPEAASL